MAEKIIIDCPECNVRVSAEAQGRILVGEPFDDTGYFLLQCPSCQSPLLGMADRLFEDFNNWTWDRAERLWPNPKRTELGESIPDLAKKDIRDAHKCLTHGIHSAAAVLCGKALERLIRDKTGSEKMLAKGLLELQQKGVIDQRLYDWADALRKERNIGAHASDEDITKENAEDILDFTIAIYDYVYTLHDKFEKYMQRKVAGAKTRAEIQSSTLALEDNQ